MALFKSIKRYFAVITELIKKSSDSKTSLVAKSQTKIFPHTRHVTNQVTTKFLETVLVVLYRSIRGKEILVRDEYPGAAVALVQIGICVNHI